MALHSIVLPVFNEEEGLPRLQQRLSPLLDRLEKQGDQFEVILVNDGSRDRSAELLNAIHQADGRFKVVHFSRNFGHQVAISAGMEWASGDTVTVMDADLQDPPELLEELIQKWREGFQVVYAVRKARSGETFFKLFTAKLFYRSMRRLTNFDIPVDTGDFRLLDRKVVDAFLSLTERHRFIRGLVSWVGFKQCPVYYDRASREHGQTHFTVRKMTKFALDGVTSFSMVPLQLATYVGLFTAGLSVLGILYIVYLKLFTASTIQGWSSLMVALLFFGSVQLLALGIIGEYLGRTYDEVKRRPLYLVDQALGFHPASVSVAASDEPRGRVRPQCLNEPHP